MASFKLAIKIIVAFALCFLILKTVGASSSSPAKVKLTVYYESLGKFCAEFIIRNLGEIFSGDLIDITNMQLIPWANATINNTNNSISCQNGPDECKLNCLESCVLNLWDDMSKNYALIYSFEFLVIEGRLEKWKNCFSELGLPQKPVLECYNQGNGTQLGRKYVNETAKLKPPHKFLPWVVVNNQPIGRLILRNAEETLKLNPPPKYQTWVTLNNEPLFRDYNNVIKYICNAYRGNSKPSAFKNTISIPQTTSLGDQTNTKSGSP